MEPWNRRLAAGVMEAVVAAHTRSTPIIVTMVRWPVSADCFVQLPANHSQQKPVDPVADETVKE